MLYDLLKAVHLFGVVLLVGNVIVTLVWKLGADRTGEPLVIAFGQRLVTLTDWRFTLGGVMLILVGGFGAAWVAGLNPFGVCWLLWGQILFGISGLLWALILIPAQIRQARQASSFATTGVIPADYWRDARRWTWWGILAIVPLLGAIWIMIAKPTAVPVEPTDRLNRGKQGSASLVGLPDPLFCWRLSRLGSCSTRWTTGLQALECSAKPSGIWSVFLLRGCTAVRRASEPIAESKNPV